MNAILYITLFSMVVIFLINLWHTFFFKPANNYKMGIEKWKVSLFISIVGLICFFIFFSACLHTISYAETITSATETYTVANNEYIEAYSYLPLMNTLFFMNFILSGVQILLGFQVFGKGHFKKNHYKKNKWQ